jgi:RNA polymerase sigma-70 factor, ECF subfamily
MPKTQRLSDTTLVRRSQQGDRRAFSALASRYDRRLRGLAYALLLDQMQMDAALGIAFMRSWRDVVRIKPRDDVGPWLYRSVYNACIDELRRNETPGGNRPAPVEVPPGAPGGLLAVLGTLAPADRVAVVLVEREGFSATSAARILGVTPDELETRLDFVRDRLAPYVTAAAPVPGPSPEAEEAPEPEDAEEPEEAVEAEDAELADMAAADAQAPVPGNGHEAAPAGATSGNGDEGSIDEPVEAVAAHVEAPGNGDTSSADVPGSEPQLPADDDADDESVPAPTATRSNGHAAARRRGRRARRRANGAARRANGAATPDRSPAGADDEAAPANGETDPDPADVAHRSDPSAAADSSDRADFSDRTDSGDRADFRDRTDSSDRADPPEVTDSTETTDPADTTEPGETDGGDGQTNPAAPPAPGEHQAADR